MEDKTKNILIENQELKDLLYAALALVTEIEETGRQLYDDLCHGSCDDATSSRE